jgi:hypothetical protein
MKQPNKINPGDPRRPICPRRVAEDANGWADRLRAERAARAPAVPAPVVVKGARD